MGLRRWRRRLRLGVAVANDGSPSAAVFTGQVHARTADRGLVLGDIATGRYLDDWVAQTLGLDTRHGGVTRARITVELCQPLHDAEATDEATGPQAQPPVPGLGSVGPPSTSLGDWHKLVTGSVVGPIELLHGQIQMRGLDVVFSPEQAALAQQLGVRVRTCLDLLTENTNLREDVARRLADAEAGE